MFNVELSREHLEVLKAVTIQSIQDFHDVKDVLDRHAAEKILDHLLTLLSALMNAEETK